jgi:hypothetical protein
MTNINDKPRKCQAKGGVENCTDPNCPEKRGSTSRVELPSQYKQLGSLTKPTVPFGAWSEKDTVLLKTVHGSKLYGLNHADSDDDYYVVTPTVRTKRALNAKHKIDGDLDVVTVDFASFVSMAENGVPQALETMFSKKTQSPFFEEYRTSWFASDPRVIDRYIRTIKSFSLDDGPKQEKYQRHAIRLSLNLEQLVYTGRFDPTLNTSDVRMVKRLGQLPKDKFMSELNAVNPFDLDWTYPDYVPKTPALSQIPKEKK